jgi:hypothetical protein
MDRRARNAPERKQGLHQQFRFSERSVFMKRNRGWVIALVLALMVSFLGLTGCGGSGSGTTADLKTPAADDPADDPEPPAPTFLSGQIIDSMVAGLSYRTKGKSSTTDGNGTFYYQAGEMVEFSIGDLILGQTAGKTIATIVDLVEGATDIDDRRALNIARLLQSLDVDGNPRNGIRITAAIRAEVGAAAIDFDQETEDFEADPAVTALFTRLNDQGVFTGGYTGALRSAEEARAHYIQACKDTWKPLHVSVDTDGDGQDDEFVDCFTDDAGRLIRMETTRSAESEPYRVEYREYDARGYLSRREYEEDGVVNRIEAYRNDADGNRIKRWYDSNGDGIWNFIEGYAFDARGNITQQSQDGNADGVYDAVYRYFFDADGKPVGREDDTNVDGIPDTRWTYVYNADGLMEREDYDDDADGTIDRALRYTYDANGNRLSMSSDQNNDGDFTDVNEWVQTWTYDANNLQKTQLTNFANTPAVNFAAYDHDDNGNLVRERCDDDYDGVTPQWDHKTTRSYDDQNRLLRMSFDYDFDGTDENEFTFVYDDFGNVVASTYSSDGITRRYTLTWQQNVTPGYDTWFAPAGGEIPN